MPSTLIAVCDHCEARLRVSAASAGKKVRCPKCKDVFRAPDAEEEQEGEQVRSSKKTVMPAVAIKVTERRSEDDEDEDKPRRAIRRRHDDDDDDDDEDRPRRRKRRSRAERSSLPLLLIGGGGLLVILIAGGIVAAILFFNGKKNSAYAKNEAAIKEVIELMNMLCDALESVKDEQSAKQAAVKINEVCDRLVGLDKRIPSLPKLSKSDDQELERKYEPEIKKADARMNRITASQRSPFLSDPDLQKAAERLVNLEKECPNLSRLGRH